jgi:hypothetical protein
MVHGVSQFVLANGGSLKMALDDDAIRTEAWTQALYAHGTYRGEQAVHSHPASDLVPIA